MVTKKQIAKEIGKDIGNAGRKILKKAITLSYPILGNLSRNLQKRIEHTIGEANYNTESVSKAAEITNLLAYSLATAIGGSNYFHNVDPENRAFLACAPLGLMYGLVESCFKGEHKISGGSLPGKLVSLPLDLATYAYDAGKKYLNDVSYRAEQNLERIAKGDSKY